MEEGRGRAIDATMMDRFDLFFRLMIDSDPISFL